MATWDQFEAASPELASLARERFDATGLVMLGTLRKNGWPRITPIEYTFWQGELVLGGIWQSRKMVDLLRDPRCSIHSATTNKSGQEGDVKLYGRATPLAPEREPAYWQHIFETMNFRPEGPAHVFTIDIESAGYVRFTPEGEQHTLVWPGGAWRVTKAP